MNEENKTILPGEDNAVPAAEAAAVDYYFYIVSFILIKLNII